MHPDDETPDAPATLERHVATKYPITADQIQDLANRFTYHAPLPDQPERYTVLRGEAKGLATRILALTPPSREQSLALTKLEEAIFWANAAIARNEDNTVPA